MYRGNIEMELIGRTQEWPPTIRNLPEFVNILGVKVNMLNLDKAVAVIDHWITHDLQNYICVSAVSTIMACHRSAEVRACVNRAGLVTPDGMPLVWLGRLQGMHAERVYGPDLMLRTCEMAVKKGYSHYFYGGMPGVPELLAGSLQKKFPGLKVAGSYSPPFRKLSHEEDEAIIQEINQSRAEIVWVGLSSPKQDLWMSEHLGKIQAPVMIGVGAAFNFHSGSVKQAPHWMQRSGLEWVFRLSQEPKRLWKRYLFDNPVFAVNVLLQLTKLKRFPI